MIAAPVWTWEIPVYFFVGGLAGASAPLAALASARGNRPLARSASLGALGGAIVSPALLISDLGRPSRFLNMLRMFKVTSPMSVGSWVLSGFGPCAALGAARETLGVPGTLGRAGQIGAALLGPVLSTYTAALVSNTAVPAWHEARRELPLVFAGSSLASAGALATVLTPAVSAAPARRMAIGGAALSLIAGREMERGLAQEVRTAYRQGMPGRLLRAAQALTVAGCVTTMLVGRRRAGAIAGAAALLSGAALERLGIFRAGFASAADPAATVAPQRERIGALLPHA